MVNGCFSSDYFPKQLALSLERRYNRGTQEPYISQEEAAMIFDTLDHIDTYKHIYPPFFLIKKDPSNGILNFTLVKLVDKQKLSFYLYQDVRI